MMKLFTCFKLLLCFSVLLVIVGTLLDRESDHSEEGSQFNKYCQCKSLFTIGGCDLDAYSSHAKGPDWWKKILKQLDAARRTGGTKINSALHQLSRYLNVTLGLKITGKGDKEYAMVRENKSTAFTDWKNVGNFDWVSSTIPHIPCKLHLYKGHEVKQCLQRRRLDKKKKLSMAFIGDSQIRTFLMNLIDNQKESLNLTNGEQTGKDLAVEFLSEFTKSKLPVYGEDIQLKFFWAPFIAEKRHNFMTTQGAFDVLEKWSRGEKVDGMYELPDIIFFDGGMWRKQKSPEPESLDELRYSFQKVLKLFNLFKKETLIIFRMNTLFKRWHAKHMLENSRVEFTNGVAWNVFGKSRVLLWDTVTPYYMKGLDKCEEHSKTGLEKNQPRVWRCYDFQHVSFIQERIAENILWNYICNRYMSSDENHCCSG